MGCCGSKSKPTAPPCTIFWEKKNAEMSLKEDGAAISAIMDGWSKGEYDGQATVEKISAEVLKTSRTGAAAQAAATGAAAGGKQAAAASRTAMQAAAISGSQAAGQNANSGGATGAAGAIGALIGGVVGGLTGAMSAAGGSQKIFDHMDLLLIHNQDGQARNQALRHLTCLETADFAEVSNHFLQVALAAHPDNGGNREEFLMYCISVEVVRGIEVPK